MGEMSALVSRCLHGMIQVLHFQNDLQSPSKAQEQGHIMNTRLALILLCSSLAPLGCDQRSGEVSAVRNSSPTPAPAVTPRPDNTARNERDASANAVSPMDQSNSASAIKITAELRRAILDDKAMSMNAQNCKIITDKDGIVTLRGPVETQLEKSAIEAKAKAIVGVTRVVNELEAKVS